MKILYCLKLFPSNSFKQNTLVFSCVIFSLVELVIYPITRLHP